MKKTIVVLAAAVALMSAGPVMAKGLGKGAAKSQQAHMYKGKSDKQKKAIGYVARKFKDKIRAAETPEEKRGLRQKKNQVVYKIFSGDWGHKKTKAPAFNGGSDSAGHDNTFGSD